MQQPLISVIVPVYDVEKYLSQCIESILAQTYKNLEIILIDDGSPDNSPSICEEYKKKDDRIIVIHKKNGGLADARNCGLDYAKGDFVAFVDSDDWIAETTYQEMMKLISEFETDIVCCAASRILKSKEVERCFSYYETGTVLSGREVTKEILLDKIGSQVVKGLYRRKCWEEVRFPLGRLYEDIPTTYKAFFSADKIAFINEPFYKYRMNEESISHTAKPIKPYHIYLGFKAHYECALTYFPEIIEECRANTAHYAISTYFHYCTGAKELYPYVQDVCAFLDENKKKVKLKMMMKSRANALRLYYFSKPLFKLFCKILHITGLQKSMNLQVK